jgi:hypothetical protein
MQKVMQGRKDQGSVMGRRVAFARALANHRLPARVRVEPIDVGKVPGPALRDGMDDKLYRCLHKLPLRAVATDGADPSHATVYAVDAIKEHKVLCFYV